MSANDKAVALAMQAAAVGTATAWAMVKKGAVNTAVKKAATKATEKAAETAVDGMAKSGGNFVTQHQANRKNKRLAFDLASQIGGSYSERTVIAGERYFVVWRGDQPIDAFPPLPKNLGSLAERPELQDFQGVRQSPTPTAKDALAASTRPPSTTKDSQVIDPHA
jgi:hypothetical protein